jgi:hypothetical protein
MWIQISRPPSRIPPLLAHRLRGKAALEDREAEERDEREWPIMILAILLVSSSE